MHRMSAETLTAGNAFETLTLLDEAVYFSHLSQASFRPSVLLNNCFDLFTESLNILRIRCEIKEYMSEALSCCVNQAS